MSEQIKPSEAVHTRREDGLLAWSCERRQRHPVLLNGAMASSEASWTSMLTFALKVSALCNPDQSVWGNGCASKLIIRASSCLFSPPECLQCSSYSCFNIYESY